MGKHPDEPEADQNRKRTWALGAGIAGFLIIGLYWAAIFTGQFNSPNPDELDDVAWVEAAGEICDPVEQQFAELPNAVTAETAEERSELLDRGSDLLDPMVDELGSNLPTGQDDLTIVTGWIKDWRSYIQDRRNFADELRKDPLTKPLITETHGGWSTDAIDTMARANNIISCATPRDM